MGMRQGDHLVAAESVAPISGTSQREIVTIGRQLATLQHHVPAAAAVAPLLYDLALAAKLIAQEIRRAGLADLLGAIGSTNVQGEAQKKLDVFADRTLIQVHSVSGRVGVIASEEDEKVITTAAPLGAGEHPLSGPYALVFDPLDGSTNTDVNITMGTIFGIYRRTSPETGPGTIADVLQPGSALLAAGYVVYGPSTMLVYSAGAGVHGFTLEPGLGEFLLSHPDIRIPEQPKYYSTNEARQAFWERPVRDFLSWLHGEAATAGDTPGPLSARYSGSLAADFHRNLLEGGIYFYPVEVGSTRPTRGKLRLLYEAAPLAFLAAQAGGYASDGTRAILDLVPQAVHQRVPLFIGHHALVERAEEFIAAAP